ncbi:antiporter inner membrane protein [Moraxella atlantae]|uniref:Iron-sulfur cluster carrier protein n=1 Tax=Faucicola atlantae TaxID=34059 RepID=A0A378Q757_9GAMM|nr:Fe-S-binding ATPase [Moraxella atlantae]STY95027.1 antiporter inner membrane protein [Moraxella atlantae]
MFNFLKPKSAASSASQPQNTAQPTALPPTTNAAPEAPITKRAPTQADLAPHPRIRHIVVVASGKGGVGKSTTTVNLALALQQLGKRVGILDADIYGPSVPAMLGVAGVQPQLENEQFVPIEAHGLAMLSIGSLLTDDTTPIAWRAAKATGALMQLFGQTNWPQLDYLLIDMPPGTGDIQLTLAQRIPVTGAVIVTTPQHIALLDAQKGVELFNKTQIPVLGIVENMALHVCSQCGHTEAIFGQGGGADMAARYGVPLLGQLPLAAGIREHMDAGTPSVVAQDEFAPYYRQIAENVDAQIAKIAKPVDHQRIF